MHGYINDMPEGKYIIETPSGKLVINSMDELIHLKLVVDTILEESCGWGTIEQE